jgi:hypothetical protein
MGLAMANVLADEFDSTCCGVDTMTLARELPHCALCTVAALLGNSTPPVYSRWRLHRLFGTFRASSAITHVLGAATMFPALPSLLPSSAAPLECWHQTS